MNQRRIFLLSALLVILVVCLLALSPTGTKGTSAGAGDNAVPVPITAAMERHSPEDDLIITLPLVMAAPAAVQAPLLKWEKGGCRTTWCRTGWYASPAVADLDKDGKPEVIWTDYRLVVVNGEDGSDQFIVDNPGGGRGWPGVGVADVDQDTFLEIVTAHSGGWLTIYNHDGSTMAGWPQQLTPGNELRSLAIGDVDNDQDMEVLVCSTRSDNQWFLLDHDGQVRPGWPVHGPDSNTNGYAAGCFNQNVGLADLTGDGALEMVGPNDTHYVVAYYAGAEPIRAHFLYGQIDNQDKPWARVGFHLSHQVDLRGYANCSPGTEPLEPRPNFADSAPSLVDVDQDGTIEIIIVGNQYDCRTSPYTSLYQLPYILNADRTRWQAAGYNWTELPAPDASAGPLAEQYNIVETVQPNPVVVDLDGDGYKEILYASYDGRVHAYWLDKTEHGHWPFQVTSAGDGFIRFASEPVVVDINNDGYAEVLLTTWTEKGSQAGGHLLVLGWDGTLQHQLDLPRSSSATWDGALPAPTIADIDGDPELEVVVGNAHTGLTAYDLPGSESGAILWGSGRGGTLRAGHP